MGDWSGFSESDLRKLKQQTNAKLEPKKITDKQKIKTKEEPDISNITHVKRKPIPKWTNPSNKNNDESKTSILTESQEKIPFMENDGKNENERKLKSSESENKLEEIPVLAASIEVPCKEDKNILSEEENVELEKQNMETLQMQQKIIEDQNKMKKMLISQTLQERFQQTKTEAQRLQDVQNELNHLEEKLQVDVEALRDKIEEASVEFAMAEKRFERSEAEYVAAKCEYFKKKECKELLVEQLYRVIQDNEVRKSNKLESIMIKLVSKSNPSSPQ